jgi:serine/threonine-protein kinase
MSLDEVGPGKTFGSYEVLEELGRGGMGRVFRARHVTLEREVALKLLAEQFAEDDFYVQRFLKEARAAARLNHPGIVQIYDFGQVGTHWYLAMELVEGRSLAHFLRTWGRFSEQNAIVLARQTLTALGVAHAAGIVHRDIKPDNVILGKKSSARRPRPREEDRRPGLLTASPRERLTTSRRSRSKGAPTSTAGPTSTLSAPPSSSS